MSHFLCNMFFQLEVILCENVDSSLISTGHEAVVLKRPEANDAGV